MTAPLFTEAEWDFSILDRTFKAIEDIALNELKLDVYPNQIEVISSEQMLDAYSSIGMPLMYRQDVYKRQDARCLFLARHAADVQSLELRKTVRA